MLQQIHTMLGLAPSDLAMLASGLSAILVAFAVYHATLAGSSQRGRLKALEARREHLSRELSAPTKRRSILSLAHQKGLLTRLAERLKLLGKEDARTVSLKLSQAGFRGQEALVFYQVARLALPSCMGVLALLMFYGFGMWQGATNWHPLISMALVLAGFKLPDLYVRNAFIKRQQALQLSLPDGLDLLLICAEAGLTLDVALSRVAGELERAAPELSDELGMTAIELGFLTDRRQALMNLLERAPLPALQGVVTTLMQSERYGTPLASSLRVLSQEFRNERLMAAEEKAARLPATMTVPLILFILPMLMVVLLGPAACQLTDNLSAAAR